MDTLLAGVPPLQRLLHFYQTVYQQGVIQRHDAPVALVDALLLDSSLHSFPALSCLPIFRQRWPNVSTAVEDGRQHPAWLHRRLIQR